MLARRFISITLLVGVSLLVSTVVMAQGAQPPAPPYPTPEPSVPAGAYRTPQGYWFMPKSARPLVDFPQATGGPDEFGYTWDDTVPLNWIDATSGTDTGMSGSSDGKKVGPIALPFSFKYYENTYTSLYIAASGYLAFTDEGAWFSQFRVPSSDRPNNVVVPYVNYFNLASSGPANRVYYMSGGTAPNRYFVVEWYQVVSGNSTFTYEVILYENGTIDFQYQTMNYDYGWLCGSAGIEDATGEIGLNYVAFCNKAPSNKAVRFQRPALSARVKVQPLYQSRFTRAEDIESFLINIRNTGELGADTFDLTTASSWATSLFAADGITPIVDSDGDGVVDTGLMAESSSITIIVKIQTPAVVNAGDTNLAHITVRSSLDSSKSKAVTLQTAIPAPFAQIYQDTNDGAMTLYLAQPAGQVTKKATPDGWYAYGDNMAVAQAPGGNFVYAWTKGRCLNNCTVSISEIEYTLLDYSGTVVRPVSKLTDYSGATVSTYDDTLAVAVAPNGHIGMLWRHVLYNRTTGQENYNIYFAILNASVNPVYGPVNLTNNNVWGDWNTLNMPRFYTPRIAATGDNRFVLAWQRKHRESDGNVEDIYYAIRDTGGNAVKGVTKFTNSTAGGDDWYGNLSLTASSNNRAVLAYTKSSVIYYAVLDSSGNTVKAPTFTGNYGAGLDAVQLSNGRIVLAWAYWYADRTIQFLVLDGTTYTIVAGPTMLSNIFDHNFNLDVAADTAGHAILTWVTDSYHNLIYALVDGDGEVLTPPMIFYTSQSTDSDIYTSWQGYGNTSYWMPPLGVDGVVSFSHSLFAGPPGGNAGVSIRYTNHGATTATHAVITATLSTGLTYLGDTSGIIPTVSGNQVVWNLPNMSFEYESREFKLYVQVPSGASYGTRYPVTLTLTSDGPEINAADNTASAEVMAARQVFLPLIQSRYP